MFPVDFLVSSYRLLGNTTEFSHFECSSWVGYALGSFLLIQVDLEAYIRPTPHQIQRKKNLETSFTRASMRIYGSYIHTWICRIRISILTSYMPLHCGFNQLLGVKNLFARVRLLITGSLPT